MLRIMLVSDNRQAALKIREKIPEKVGQTNKIQMMENMVEDIDLSHISNPNINNKVVCVGIGDTLSEAMVLYKKYHPHLAICSSRFNQGTALEFIGKIRENEKNMHFIVYDTVLDALILRGLISYGVDAFVLWNELMSGELLPLLEEIHRRTLVEATRRQFFFEKAIMDLFNKNTQNYIKHQDYLFFEKLEMPYYFIYFERDILSPFDEIDGKIISFENDNNFFKKVYSTFEFLVDTNLYVTTCMKVRQFRYLLVCEPLEPSVPMTPKRLEQSVQNFRQQLKLAGLGGSMSFMIYPTAMSLEKHMELYGRTKFQFYNKYWYHRPTTFFMDADRYLIMKDYKVDFNELETLVLTKNMDIYAYMDKIFEPSFKTKDYAGFKMLFSSIENYFEMNYPGKYIPAFKKETLRYASFPELVTWLKMNVANLMEYHESYNFKEHAHLIRQVVDFIKKNYGDSNLTLGQIAGNTRYQSNYLNIVFKKEMGCTIMEFVNRFRVQVAKHLLMNRELSIKEIGVSVGFHSAQYFATVFKKQTGCSPKQFRQK